MPMKQENLVVHAQKCSSTSNSVVGQGLRGATVARLTPDQKVACSNHVGVKVPFERKFPRISSASKA